MTDRDIAQRSAAGAAPFTPHAEAVISRARQRRVEQGDSTYWERLATAVERTVARKPPTTAREAALPGIPVLLGAGEDRAREAS